MERPDYHVESRGNAVGTSGSVDAKSEDTSHRPARNNFIYNTYICISVIIPNAKNLMAAHIR